MPVIFSLSLLLDVNSSTLFVALSGSILAITSKVSPFSMLDFVTASVMFLIFVDAACVASNTAYTTVSSFTTVSSVKFTAPVGEIVLYPLNLKPSFSTFFGSKFNRALPL